MSFLFQKTDGSRFFPSVFEAQTTLVLTSVTDGQYTERINFIYFFHILSRCKLNRNFNYETEKDGPFSVVNDISVILKVGSLINGFKVSYPSI